MAAGTALRTICRVNRAWLLAHIGSTMPRQPDNGDEPTYLEAIIIVLAVAAACGLLYLAAQSFLH
jgi:hypothetical protein